MESIEQIRRLIEQYGGVDNIPMGNERTRFNRLFQERMYFHHRGDAMKISRSVNAVSNEISAIEAAL